MAERFKGFNISAPQATTPTTGTQAAIGQATRNIASLSDRLEAFSKKSLQVAAAQAANEATRQAAIDDVKGKEFHEENVHTIYGKAYNNVRSASYAANSEIDLTATSQRLSQELQGDPVGYRNAMKEYINTLQKDAPTPELQSVINISGKKITNHAFGKMSIAKDAEIKAFQKEEYTQNVNLKIGQAINAKSSGDQKTFDLIMSSMTQYTTTMQESGAITPAEVLKIKDIAEFTINKGVAEQNITDLVSQGNFDEAIKKVNKFDEEIQEGYTVKGWKAVSSSMSSILGSGLKREKLLNAQIKKEADNKIRDSIKIMENGKYPDTPVTDEDLANASPSIVEKFTTQETVSDILSKFSGDSLIEKEEKLNEFKSSREASKTDIKVMKGLEENIRNERQAWTKDPMSQGQAVGFYTLNSFDMNSPEDVPSILNERMINSDLNQEEAGSGAYKLLTTQEANALSDFMAGDVPISEKQKMISIIAHSRDGAADRIFKQVGQKKAFNFAFAGDLALIGNESASLRVLQGKNADVTLETGLKQDLQARLSGVFNNYTAEDFNKNLKGMTDYAKGKILTGEDIGSAADIIEETIGRPIKYNSKQTILPFGVEKDDFETWLDDIQIPNRPSLSKGLNDLTDTIFNGEYQLHHAGNGKYLIWNDNGGNGYYATQTDDDTKPFILEWGK
jgi:hypothetical protein